MKPVVPGSRTTGEAMQAASKAVETPTWSTFQEAIRIVLHPPFLRKTVRTALIVGLVLFSINHLDEVFRGQAHAATWLKGLLTCVVPFTVANWGILIATRKSVARPDPRQRN